MNHFAFVSRPSWTRRKQIASFASSDVVVVVVIVVVVVVVIVGGVDVTVDARSFGSLAVNENQQMAKRLRSLETFEPREGLNETQLDRLKMVFPTSFGWTVNSERFEQILEAAFRRRRRCLSRIWAVVTLATSIANFNLCLIYVLSMPQVA